MAGPLSHLRVLEIADLRGAFAGRLLADLGAEVFKVEPPGGESDRLTPPFAGGVAGGDRSLAFVYRNANKHLVTLDIFSSEGKGVLADLLDRVDVLIENLGPAGHEKLGFDPHAVTAEHPHLVHVSMADFGLTGPRTRWRLEPLPAFAASGALWASGFYDHPPCWLPGYVAHDCASTFAACGALMAVLDRERTGRGQHIEVSVQEAAISGLYPWAIPLADYARLYPILPASPPRNADGAYYVLPCADGFVRALAATSRQWRGFVELLGSPEALLGPEWEIPIMRFAGTDVIRMIATEALKDRSRAEVVREALRRRVPMAPVNTPEQFVAEEQTRHRGTFRNTGFPHVGDAPFVVPPFRLSETPAELRRSAPQTGENDSFPEPRPAKNDTTAELPSATGLLLDGMRVVNLGVGAVVPELCWLLSELGAEVIKIESRANLDFMRAVTIEPGGYDKAFTFNHESRGQKSVCLDLSTAKGREVALALCAKADIVAENNRGGVVAQWGLDYEDVRRVRPDVIYVASQGFGRGGPWGEAPSFGPLNSSFSGANFLWNHPDTPYPAGSSHSHPDHIASKLVGVAVLAAIEHRRRTGVGQLIDMAQTEAAAYLQGEFYLQESCTGRPTRRMGNALEWAVPHGVYRCDGDDRWVAIAVMNDEQWNRFERAAGWESKPAWRTTAERIAAREAIDAKVYEWTGTRSPEDVATQLQAAGVSAMMAHSPEDTRNDPHLAARKAILLHRHPEVGDEHQIANPVRPSATKLRTAAPAPLLGADTAAVLGDWLGVPAEQVSEWEEQGVCR